MCEPGQIEVVGDEIEIVGDGSVALATDVVALPQAGVVTVAVYTPGLLTEVVAVVAPLLQE